MTRKAKRPIGLGNKKSVYYSTLSPANLDKLARPFDREFVSTRPMPATMRAAEQRARRKRGRPPIGEGAAKILVSVERGLLRQTDAYARKHHKNRSQVIVECLQAMLFPIEKRKAS